MKYFVNISKIYFLIWTQKVFLLLSYHFLYKKQSIFHNPTDLFTFNFNNCMSTAINTNRYKQSTYLKRKIKTLNKDQIKQDFPKLLWVRILPCKHNICVHHTYMVKYFQGVNGISLNIEIYITPWPYLSLFISHYSPVWNLIITSPI